MKRLTFLLFITLIFSLLGRVAIASVPEPINPRESVSFSFEQRLAHAKQLHAKLKEATPSERLMFWDKSIEAIKKLAPEERRALGEKFKTQWKKLSDEQKREIKQESRNYITSLPDSERKELKRRREYLLEFMTLEEQKHWP